MPPRSKKSKPRGTGGNSIEDIMERNRMERDEDGKLINTGKGGYGGAGKGGGKGQAQKQESSDDSSADEQVKPVKKGVAALGIEVENPNSGTRHVDKDGVELSRKQREEIEKQAARRRYEELHKAGKTDEAKADLARLEEVKKRREEAKKKREEEEAAAKEKEAKEREKGGMSSEVKEALGGEAARLRGERSQKNKTKEDEVKRERKPGPDLFTFIKDDTTTDKAPEKAGDEPQEAGNKNIHTCRAAEDDFM